MERRLLLREAAALEVADGACRGVGALMGVSDAEGCGGGGPSGGAIAAGAEPEPEPEPPEGWESPSI